MVDQIDTQSGSHKAARLKEFMDQVYADVLRMYRGHAKTDARPMKMRILNNRHGIQAKREFGVPLRKLLEQDSRFHIYEKQDFSCLVSPRSEIDAMFDGNALSEEKFFIHF